jgi:ABC-type polysaccharide/polyol phosphate transport system ATPase subunit
MSELAVEAEGLSKTYRIYDRPFDRLYEVIRRRPRHRAHHALQDVSLALPAGQSMGLIGENGAGKSTLLKILAGITVPTSGRAAVRGKIASILELGSGFHPDFSGRDNIALNAALLGLDDRELRERLPAIIEFSELGEFIDQPVKTYSTGMVVRLGFSIATQVDPDVLIIDEALSVGDGYFQKKCVDRLLDLVGQGKTLLFCSHAMYYISAFCQTAIWLRKGRVEAAGPALDVVRAYETFLLAKAAPETPAAKRPLEGPARLRDVRLLGPEGAPGAYRLGDPWTLEISWESEIAEERFHVGVGVNRLDEVEIFACATQRDGLPPFTGAHEYRVRLRVPRLPLAKGEFSIYVFLLDGEGLHVFDRRLLRGAFAAASTGYTAGLMEVEHEWQEVERAAEPRPAQPGELVAAERSR